MSYELQDIISLGPDGEGQFQFIVVQTLVPEFASDEEDIPTPTPLIPTALPITEGSQLPQVPPIGMPAMPTLSPVTLVPLTTENLIALPAAEPNTKPREYPYFPDQLKKELACYVSIQRFPEQWKTTVITQHPELNWVYYDVFASQALLITLPRKKYGQSYWNELAEVLTPEKAELLKQYLAARALVIIPSGENCHCDNYYPGIGCGYKGTKEQICMNCAPLCPICLEPVASLYEEGTDREGCYDCVC